VFGKPVSFTDIWADTSPANAVLKDVHCLPQGTVYRGADKSLARPGRETNSEACQGGARFQQHRDASCHQVVFPVRQGAEGNSGHSERNISLFPSWSG